MNLKVISAVSILAMSLAYSGVAHARVPQPPHSMTQHSKQKIHVSNKTMGTFIKAQSRVMRIRKTYIAKIQKASDKKTQEKLAIQANKKMQAAVIKAPMSLKRYNMIARALPYNKDLQRQYDHLLRQK